MLVASGMTKQKALCMQFVTAVGALAGCVMGLVAGGLVDRLTQSVLPFTAGGFIYIALADTVPALMEVCPCARLCTRTLRAGMLFPYRCARACRQRYVCTPVPIVVQCAKLTGSRAEAEAQRPKRCTTVFVSWGPGRTCWVFHQDFQRHNLWVGVP